MNINAIYFEIIYHVPAVLNYWSQMPDCAVGQPVPLDRTVMVQSHPGARHELWPHNEYVK